MKAHLPRLGFHFILPPSSFILALQPFAAVDGLGLAGEEDFAVFAPEDFEQTAGHVHADAAVCASADHRGDRSRARARARRERLARAALPDARLYVAPVERADELDVRAFGERGVRLDCATQATPVHALEVLDEDAAVRVAHL